MISQPETSDANDTREAAAPALSMPRVVATLQLLLATRRAARIAQQQRLAELQHEDEEIAA